MISNWTAALVIAGLAFGAAAAAQPPQREVQPPARGMGQMPAQMQGGQMMPEQRMMNEPEMMRQMELMSEGCGRMMARMAAMRPAQRR